MKVFYVHWNEAELQERIAPLIGAGHEVQAHFCQGEQPKPGERLPDVFVLSLDRLPSHSMAIAEWVWEAKKRRHVPIIFEGGKEDKLPAFKERFPGALFVNTGNVLTALSKR